MVRACVNKLTSSKVNYSEIKYALLSKEMKMVKSSIRTSQKFRVKQPKNIPHILEELKDQDLIDNLFVTRISIHKAAIHL